uniref:Secreted protein n=1 Tax=Rhipicephalus appendiculatus TaxID=34631 RepID=A0A131YE39_RHIAP
MKKVLSSRVFLVLAALVFLLASMQHEGLSCAYARRRHRRPRRNPAPTPAPVVGFGPGGVNVPFPRAGTLNWTRPLRQHQGPNNG